MELTCAFVFAYTKYVFSFDAAHVSKQTYGTLIKALFLQNSCLGANLGILCDFMTLIFKATCKCQNLRLSDWSPNKC